MTQMRPSRMAIEVARSLVYLSRDRRFAQFLPRRSAELTEELLVAAGLLPRSMQRLLGERWFHRFGDTLADHVGIPSWHFGLRKRFVDDEVRTSISQGARQLLVVGAGFDTLGVRIAEEFPEMTVVEIDHPATQGRKRSATEALGITPGNLFQLGIDLGDVPLGRALSRLPAWDVDAMSVIVAEGVLMYLTSTQAMTLLSEVPSICRPGSRLVFSWARSDASGHPDAGRYGRLGERMLALMGEPVGWCVRNEHVLRELLAERGFVHSHDASRFDLRARYLVPAGLGNLGPCTLPEVMAVAERR